MALAARKPCSHPGCNVLSATGRCEKHPRIAWQREATAVKRTLVGRRRQRMRDLVFNEQPICCDCNRRPSAELDHEIPIEEGGSDDRENLRGRCVECHAAKTQREAARGVVRTGWGGSKV